MRTTQLAAFLILVAWSSGAAAQDIFSMRSVNYEAIEGAAPDAALGIDDRGYIYLDKWSGQTIYQKLMCYHPSDPVGSRVIPELPEGDWIAAMTWDHRGLAAMGWGGPSISFRIIRCGAGDPGYEVDNLGDIPGALPHLGRQEQESGDPVEMVMSPDDRFCFLSWKGLDCVEPDAEAETLSWKTEISLEEVDRDMEQDPGLITDVLFAGGQGEVMEDWELRSVLWLPDGELNYLVAVRYRTKKSNGDMVSSDWQPYVARRGEDGKPQVVVEPPRPAMPGAVWKWGDRHTSLYNPLFYCRKLYFYPRLGAILAWPSAGMEFNSSPIWTGLQTVAGGSGGYGFLVIPLEEDNVGYLSMLHGRVQGASAAPDQSSDPLTEADLNLVFPLITGAEAGLYRVGIDLDRLDLDTDGLSWNEEVAAGSSDFTIQSDWGTTADSVEVRVTGTDPASIKDEPAAFMNDEISYVESGLVRKLFQDLGLETDRDLTQGTPGDGPLCFQADQDGMECVLEDGRSRVVVPAPYGTPVRFSTDGSFVMFLSEQGLQRYHFPSGRREPAVSMERLALALDRIMDDYTMDFFPGGDERTYVTFHRSMAEGDQAWDEFLVFSFTGDEDGKLIYDHQKARCDSGLGPCDPSLDFWESIKDGVSGKLYPHDLLVRGVMPVGYFPELDRMVIDVAGRWGRYYVALHPDHQARVLVGPNYLAGGPDAQGMPNRAQPTGWGDYFVGSGFLDGYLAARSFSWIQGFSYSKPPTMFWNGLAASMQEDGLWESIRYQGKGDPGDVVLVGRAEDDLGAMAWRSGPRGGLAYAWDEPYALEDIWGVDISPDGLLCVARRSNWYERGGVDVLEAETVNGIPSNVIMSVGDVGDVTDCHWGEDGSLYWLRTDPPSIERLPELWVEEFEVVETLNPDSEPIDLIVAPDGSFEVLDSKGPYRGFTYLRDGRRLEVSTSDFHVWVEGEDVTNLNTVIYGVYGVPVSDSAPAFLRFLERADGLVVVVPFGVTDFFGAGNGGTALIFDPDSGELWPLSSNQVFPQFGNGLALMPGGEDRYPWSRGAYSVLAAGPAGPASEPVPLYGYPETREPGCGVAEGPVSSGPLLILAGLVLAILAAGARRKRGLLLSALVLALAAGCGGSEGEGDGSSQGEKHGQNTESLEPLVVGSRFVVTESGQLIHRVVAEELTIADREGRRVFWSDGTVNTWRHAAEGWTLYNIDGVDLDPPLLLVPDKVFPGKTWTTGDLVFTVLSRRLDLTPWGERYAWRILRSGGGVVDKIRVYVEGRGWWKDEDQDHRVVASFIPEQPVDAGISGPESRTLEPFPGSDGEQLILDIEGAPLFAVQDEPGSLVTGIRGLSWGFLNGTWVLVTHNECLRLDGSGPQTLSLSENTASFIKDANAQCFTPPQGWDSVGAADFTHMEVSPWISAEGEHFYVEDANLPSEVRYLLGEGTSAAPRVLSFDKSFARFSTWANESFSQFDPLRLWTDPLEVLNHFDAQEDGRIAPMILEDGAANLGVLTHSGVLVESRFSKDQGLDRPLPRFFTGFSPVITTTSSGHRALFSKPDHVDELTYEDGNARLVRTARFELPKNHFITGSIRLDDELIITTGDRVDGADPYNNKDARRTYFWRIAAPRGQGTALTPPASLAVGALVNGVDLVVCWPETGDELSLDGWTLGGAPAAGVRQLFGDGNCALVIRDLEQARDSWLEGGNRVTGPVPGVGLMEITAPPGPKPLIYDRIYTERASPADLWATPDGGFIGLEKVYDSWGLPQFHGPYRLHQWTGLGDAAGNGYWRINGGRVELISSEGEIVQSAQEWVQGDGNPMNISLIGRAAGGGVLVSAPSGGQDWSTVLVEVDGSITQLPPAPYQGITSATVTDAGIYCATMVYKGLQCRGEGGELVTVEELPEEISSAVLHPLPDGGVLAVLEDRAWLVDPVARTATPYGEDLDFHGHYVWDFEGTLYFLPMIYNGSSIGWDTPSWLTRPYVLTREGPKPLDLPELDYQSGFQENIAALVPAIDCLFLFFANDQFVRVPR